MNGETIVYWAFTFLIGYGALHEARLKEVTYKLAAGEDIYHLNLELIQEEPINLIDTCFIHKDEISWWG